MFMKLKALIIAVVLISSCNTKNKNIESLTESNKAQVVKNTAYQDLEVFDFKGFEKFLNRKDDKIYVINFWATWCAPCIKELPYFELINTEYGDKNVEVILVSLDFPHLYESKLKPFIKENQLHSKVIALDDADMNSWIPKVDKSWSGSIPATLIYKKDMRKFFEQAFDYKTLKAEVAKFLK